MAEIPGPYEILELADGESLIFHVLRFEEGTMVIHPTWPGAPESKEVEGLRIHVPATSKEWLPYYWDVTAAHLVGGLKPLLPMLIETEKWVKITAGLMRPGDQASKRFKITWEE